MRWIHLRTLSISILHREKYPRYKQIEISWPHHFDLIFYDKVKDTISAFLYYPVEDYLHIPKLSFLAPWADFVTHTQEHNPITVRAI